MLELLNMLVEFVDVLIAMNSIFMLVFKGNSFGNVASQKSAELPRADDSGQYDVIFANHFCLSTFSWPSLLLRFKIDLCFPILCLVVSSLF